MAKQGDAGAGAGAGAKAKGQRVLSVAVPVAPVSTEAYVPRHVEVQLDPIQQVGLRAVFNALHAEPPARLASGRYVQTFPDAVRWVLETIGEALDQGREKRAKGNGRGRGGDEK